MQMIRWKRWFLQTGHIEVSDANGIRIASIKPEQEFFLDKRDLKFSLNKVESEQYTCWKEGKLIFRNENIEDMAVRFKPLVQCRSNC